MTTAETKQILLAGDRETVALLCEEMTDKALRRLQRNSRPDIREAATKCYKQRKERRTKR